MNFTPPALSQPLGFADGDAERFPRHEVNRAQSRRSAKKRSEQGSVLLPDRFPWSGHHGEFPISFPLNLSEITTSLLKWTILVLISAHGQYSWKNAQTAQTRLWHFSGYLWTSTDFFSFCCENWPMRWMNRHTLSWRGGQIMLLDGISGYFEFLSVLFFTIFELWRKTSSCQITHLALHLLFAPPSLTYL